MTTTSEPLTVIRQPAPPSIESPQAALATYLLDPDLNNPVSAYAAGWLTGSLAGARCAAEVLSSQDRRDHDEAYGTHLRPLPLVAALRKHSSPSVMWTVGWLSGWRYGTEGAPDRHECAVCARALLDDLDSFHHCSRDLEYLCAAESHACYYDVCSGPAHAACHEDGN